MATKVITIDAFKKEAMQILSPWLDSCDLSPFSVALLRKELVGKGISFTAEEFCSLLNILTGELEAKVDYLSQTQPHEELKLCLFRKKS